MINGVRYPDWYEPTPPRTDDEVWLSLSKRFDIGPPTVTSVDAAWASPPPPETAKPNPLAAIKYDVGSGQKPREGLRLIRKRTSSKSRVAKFTPEKCPHTTWMADKRPAPAGYLKVRCKGCLSRRSVKEEVAKKMLGFFWNGGLPDRKISRRINRPGLPDGQLVYVLDLFKGSKAYSTREAAELLPLISSNAVASRISDLVKDGILERLDKFKPAKYRKAGK